MFNFVQVLDTCDSLMPVIKFIKRGVFPIIQIGIPIILIIMGSIDLGKAVLSSDDKAIKAAQGALIKRCIAAVAVFFVVTLVSLLMGLFTSSGADENGDIEGTDDWRTCWDRA